MAVEIRKIAELKGKLSDDRVTPGNDTEGWSMDVGTEAKEKKTEQNII